MKRHASLSAIIIALFLLNTFIFYVNGEVDKTSTVTRVIDGDTFDISSGERIRLADVDAPETYETGYSQAKSYLTSLIGGRTVYLDIYDIYRTDKYGRLVCVVFIDYNSSHMMNVNKVLLVGGYAVISNYDNEFSPHSWSLFLLKNVVPEPTLTPSPSITPTPTLKPSPTPPQPTSTPESGPSLFPPIEALFGIGAIITTAIIIVILIALRKRKLNSKNVLECLLREKRKNNFSKFVSRRH